MIVPSRQRGGLDRVARQELEEPRQALLVERQHRRKLPEDGAELLVQRERAGREEIRQRLLHAGELLHVSNEPPALDREHEAFGGIAIPLPVELGPLQRVERAVDLHRAELTAGVFQLAALRKALWIEDA